MYLLVIVAIVSSFCNSTDVLQDRKMFCYIATGSTSIAKNVLLPNLSIIGLKPASKQYSRGS